MRIHLGKKDHKCPHCDYSSVRKDNLKSHMKTHDKNNDQSTTRKRTTPTSDLPTFLNHQQFALPRINESNQSNFKNSKQIRIHHSTKQNGSTLNYAFNGFYPSVYPGLYGNTFCTDSLSTLNKRRKIEDQKINVISANISEKAEEPIKCEVKKTFSEEDKFAAKKQQILKINDKIDPVELFRPYLH